VLALYVQDEVFDLKRKLVGVAIRTPASVREPLHAAFLITIEDLIAGLAGDAELLAKFGSSPRRLAGEPQTAVFHPLPNTPSKASLPPLDEEKVSPMCPVQCITYVSGRSTFLNLSVTRLNPTPAFMKHLPKCAGCKAVIAHLNHESYIVMWIHQHRN
jgi:hypothetical protein